MKALILLIGLTGVASGVNYPCLKNERPVWPSAYTVAGTLSIPYTELLEPFHAWYNAEEKSSRIDYYGGTAKTFQFGKSPTIKGSYVKIVPETTEEFMNKKTCFKVDGAGDVQPQSVLPDLSKFTCHGTGLISGKKAQKWTFTEKIEEKTSHYIFWVQWKQNTQSKKREPIPVYYEMKGFNSLMGSHYDHYYISYHNYISKIPDKAVWNLPNNMQCTGFPGPGLTASQLATFNPIKEFVHNYDDHVNMAWDEFVDTHNKTYNDKMQHTIRKHIFKQNHRFVQSHNRAGRSFNLAINRLADWTNEELKTLRGTRKSLNNNGGAPFPYDEKRLSRMTAAVPINFDWRLHGAVNRVKDQSVCGSCWSFGSTGTIEGAYFVKTGQLISLSEQALIDCSWGYGNNGCDGGEDYRSYAWIMKHGGLPLEEEYGPYLGMDGRCHYKQVTLHAPITGYVNVTTGNEDALRVAIFKKGPISISINAALRTFSFYSNGVFDDKNCKGGLADLDHSVLAVGFGVMEGKKYWLVKNSWSNYWGNDGYILIAVEGNICGVLTAPTYVTM